MKKILFIISFFYCLTQVSFSQESNPTVVQALIFGEDTLIIVSLPEFCVNSKMPANVKADHGRRYTRLVRNVKKAYPYAKLVGIKLNEYENLLVNASGEIERKQLMKQAEKELKDEFEDDIKKLTFKQGAILIKLVDRETGNSSFVLIQELRGKVVAFFWQTFARLFGYNLKEEYDPYGKDKDIEEIVVLIENGQI